MSSRLDFDERRARALEGRRPVPARRRAAAAAAGERSGGRRRDPRARPSRRNAVRDGDGGADGDAPISAEATRAATAQGGAARRDAGRASGADREQAAYDSAASREPADRGASEPARVVKLAVVVQRYGADINGGAELHARYIAERLVAPRRRRSRDDLRARLRHLEERAARRRRARQRRPGPPLSGQRTNAGRSSSAGALACVFDAASLGRRRARAGSRARDRRARR